MTTAKTQDRAECAACGREQAVNDAGLLVHHGYQVKGFGYFVGSCHGTKKAHFGTPEGRDFRSSVAAGLRRFAEEQTKIAEAVRAGTAKVYRTKRVLGRSVGQEEHPDPSAYDRHCYASGFEWEAKQANRTAADLEKSVAEWVEKAPRVVVAGGAP